MPLFFYLTSMERVKKNSIGKRVYIPLLGTSTLITEDSAEVLLKAGLFEHLEDDKPKPKKTATITNVKELKDDAENLKRSAKQSNGDPKRTSRRKSTK